MDQLLQVGSLVICSMLLLYYEAVTYTEKKDRNPGYFALKVFKRNYDDSCKKEFDTYQSIAKANPFLPGHRHVRTATSIFAIERNGQQHQCLVQQPMWDSWRDLLYRNPSGRFSAELLKGGLKHLLLALDYLHKEFKLVHTGILILILLPDSQTLLLTWLRY